MNPTITQRLSQRVRHLVAPASMPLDNEPLPGGLLQYLQTHLERGETHYTTRPGMLPLRRAIDDLLCAAGLPQRREGGVVVTASEGESMYVVLLGIGIATGSIVVADDGPHADLFKLMDITTVTPGSDNVGAAVGTYTDWSTGPKESAPRDVLPHVIGLGSRVTNSDLSLDCNPEAIVIGDLHGLSHLRHFRVGFVSAPPDVAKRIMTWKQALSICTAAPSQRAAMFHLKRDAE